MTIPKYMTYEIADDYVIYNLKALKKLEKYFNKIKNDIIKYGKKTFETEDEIEYQLNCFYLLIEKNNCAVVGYVFEEDDEKEWIILDSLDEEEIDRYKTGDDEKTVNNFYKEFTQYIKHNI